VYVGKQKSVKTIFLKTSERLRRNLRASSGAEHIPLSKTQPRDSPRSWVRNFREGSRSLLRRQWGTGWHYTRRIAGELVVAAALECGRTPLQAIVIIE
jgi:hypothetical protein